MLLPRAKTTDEAIAQFDFRHGIAGTDERWVDLGPAREDVPLATVIGRRVRTHGTRPFHALLLGHRGTGKSTELNRLAEELRPRALVKTVNAETVLEPEDVELSDVVLALVQAVLEVSKDHDLELPEGDLRLLAAWGEERTETSATTRESQAEVEAGLKVGAGPALLGSVLGLVAGFTARIRLGTHQRAEVRRVFEPRLPELLAVVERLSAAAMDGALGRGQSIAILVDGLDLMRFDPRKGDAASSYEHLFLFNAPQLQRCRTHLVMVAPIGLAVRGRADQAWEVYPLANVQVRTRQGGLKERGISALLDLIGKRAAIDDLFLDREAAARRVAILSGGNVRDMLRIVASAVDRTLEEHLSTPALEHAASSLGSDLWARTRDEDERTYLDAVGDASVDVTADPMVQRLLQLGVLLNYRNSEHWAAVHPCIRLLRRGRANDPASP